VPWTDANGISIHFELAGNGPSVVLLHEMGGTLDSWDEIAPALSKRFRVLRYDQRGSGRTEKVRAITTEILVEDLPESLYVPVQSVFRRGPETLAFVVRSGEAQARAVEVGRSNALWVQVLSGLQEGESVLLKAPVGFEPGGTSEAPEKPAEKTAKQD